MTTNTSTTSLQSELQHKINNKTKPVGALGRLEEVALRIGLIQQSVNPQISQPHIIVFAGDHGIAQTGLVNPYPQQVTAQMVLNFLQGGAAINVFCRQHHITLKVVDAGVNNDFDPALYGPHFMDAKIGYETNNYLDEQAMSREAVLRAIDKGKEIVRNIAATGCNCIGFGEMGIANTSSAALIMSAVTGIPVEQCTGRGTGVNDEQFKTKTATLKKVYEKHQPGAGNEQSPINILQCFGGFEIAMMTGAYLQAAEQRMIIVVDGFIAGAALLLTRAINANVHTYCIFAHTSQEQGHEKMLRYLDAEPLLNLQMRLGEGTGAALAIPLIQSAVNFMNEMASFESAGVSTKE